MHGTGTCGSLIYLAVSLCAHTPVAAQALPHVSVVIGNLLPSEGGTADARLSVLNSPFGIDFDRRGNMLIVELEGGHALRVVTPNGRIRTVAGTGERGDRDGPARQAQLNSPKHLCVDGDDNVIIADDQNGLIRKYSPTTQTVTSLLGRGQSEPPVRLSHPHGVCFDSGSLYVVDTGNNRILRVEEARRESLRTPP